MSNDGKHINWSEEEMVLFLQLWSKKSVQDKFDGTVRNNRIFKELTDKLAEAGYQQTLLTDRITDARKNVKTLSFQ